MFHIILHQNSGPNCIIWSFVCAKFPMFAIMSSLTFALCRHCLDFMTVSVVLSINCPQIYPEERSYTYICYCCVNRTKCHHNDQPVNVTCPINQIIVWPPAQFPLSYHPSLSPICGQTSVKFNYKNIYISTVWANIGTLPSMIFSLCVNNNTRNTVKPVFKGHFNIPSNVPTWQVSLHCRFLKIGKRVHHSEIMSFDQRISFHRSDL